MAKSIEINLAEIVRGIQDHISKAKPCPKCEQEGCELSPQLMRDLACHDDLPKALNLYVGGINQLLSLVTRDLHRAGLPERVVGTSVLLALLLVTQRINNVLPFSDAERLAVTRICDMVLAEMESEEMAQRAVQVATEYSERKARAN